MYSFNKYKIEKGKNFYILSCENILQYKSEDDEFKEEYLAAITPSCWDETLVSKINLNAYHIYHIYGMQMLHGCYNRISDYKGVCKLSNRPVGIYENAYITPDGKVYWGMSSTLGIEGFYSDISSILIICPQMSNEQCNRIFSVFKKNNYNFSIPASCGLLESISFCCPQSIILSYSSTNESNLIIYPGDTDLDLTESDCMRWEFSVDVQPVFRRK